MHAQRSVTDTQPHASFGSVPMFLSAHSTEERTADEDIVDLTGNDEAGSPVLLRMQDIGY